MALQSTLLWLKYAANLN